MPLRHRQPSRLLRRGSVAVALFGAVSSQGLAQTAPGGSVEGVVVTASRRPQPVEQLGGSLTVVSADTIDRQQLITLSDVLKRVPGVAITRSGGLGQNTQVRMRGFTTKHVLMMVDGVKLNNPSASANQFGLEHLMLDNVERVEVLRGPQSGLYGGDASAGVINLITRRPEGRPDLRLSTMHGDHDTHEVSVGSIGRVGAVGYSASASLLQSEGISLASRPPANVELDGYRNMTLSGRADWDVTESFNVEGWVRYLRANNEIDAGFLPAGNPLGLPAFLFQDSQGAVQNDQVFAMVRGRLESYGGRLTHEAKVSIVDLDTASSQPGLRQNSDGRTTEAGYYATLDLGGQAFVQAGVERKQEAGSFEQPTGGGFATVNDSIEETGLFATFSVSPLAGAYLSGAVRRDDNSLFGGNTTYRLTGAYNLAEGADLPGVDTKLRAAYGTGAEAPGLRQLLGASPTYRGNPNLTPESSRMWDIGVDQSLENGFASWSLTYYQGSATDGIFNIFAAGVSSPQNVDSPVEMSGVEAELRLRPASWIDLDLSYTDSEAALTSDGVQLFGRPKRQGAAAVTLRPTPKLSVTLDGYWRSEFFSDYPTTYVMPSYGIVSLSAGWTLTDRVRLNASIHNLTDKVYEEKLGDATYGRTAQVRISARF